MWTNFRQISAKMPFQGLQKFDRIFLVLEELPIIFVFSVLMDQARLVFILLWQDFCLLFCFYHLLEWQVNRPELRKGKITILGWILPPVNFLPRIYREYPKMFGLASSVVFLLINLWLPLLRGCKDTFEIDFEIDFSDWIGNFFEKR